VSEWRVNIGQVEYGYNRLDIGTVTNAFDRALKKRKSYEHERELRAVLSSTPHKGRGGMVLKRLADPGEYVDVNLELLIETVHLSPLAKDWLVETTDLLLQMVGLPLSSRRSPLMDGPNY